ncbi:type VII secretion-associated protein [Actinomycetospora straminea]|uniref:Type VII secretion-associated protein (TIGR03931 family) n=1 Tax=Actinomycetospora straminea TaxID=663607 RepID=A0ABP9E450_9PSEU|nr:type VII secretion-associated protein [Actinomycetospora straminea]MDD7931260.1 type VII secretion-associated protein [Actinomycetospora straminea]
MSDGPTVAIDLGVTTVAAAVDAAPPREPVETVDPADVRAREGAPVELAAVFAPADGTALAVGAEARRLAVTDPSRYEPTPRLRVDEPDLLLGTRVVGVSEAWGAVLAGVLDRAGPLLRGGRPRRLVLTHPAGWDGGRREVLRRAGSGLAEELTLVAEPVAAAAHAAWMRPRDTARPQPLAVLDLGARGASATVLAPEPGRCGGAAVLAHRDDDRFGGDDADDLLLGHLLTTLGDEPDADVDRVREVVAGTTLADRRHRQVLLDDVRAAKEQLSDAEQAAVPLPGRVTASWLSRGELIEVLRPALRGVVDLLADTLAAAGTGPEHLDDVWLTGGGARIPLLAALVHRELGVPATVAPEPRLVVARGALVVAREEEAARPGGAGSGVGSGAVPGPPRPRVPAVAAPVGAAVTGAAGAWTGAWTGAAGPLLDPPTVELPPAERVWAPAPRGGEVTDDLGGRVDGPEASPDWLTPTSPGRRDALLPVRRVGRDDSDPTDRTGPADPVPPLEPDGPVRSRRLPARRPRPPARGRVGVGAVIVALLAVVALVTGVVLGARALQGPTGTTTVVGGQAFVAPLGWVLAGGDPAARRVLLRPTDAPRGTDLVAVQENPLDPAAATDPDRARDQLAAQYEAARAAGDPVADYDPRAEFGGRDVARYRQDPAPGVRVDWFVVLSSPSMVSVGCRHGTDEADARRVLAACEQVVETLEPAG